MKYKSKLKDIRKLIEKRDKLSIILLLFGLAFLFYALTRAIGPLIIAFLFFISLYYHSKRGGKNEK